MTRFNRSLVSTLIPLLLLILVPSSTLGQETVEKLQARQRAQSGLNSASIHVHQVRRLDGFPGLGSTLR